jgi:two-component system, cell cycle sensor histidine kinase and response regulator CckA
MPKEAAAKISKELLRASELRYRRLFETAKDGILILDAKTGQIIDVNPFLVNLLGYAHDEFIGMPLWEIGPFKDVKECKLAFTELQEAEYIRYESLPLETKDGRLIAVEFVSNVYGLKDGTRVVQCNIRDITKRKAGEDALHRSEAEYRFFFQSNLAGNYVATPSGKVLSCNSAFAGMFGFASIEEALKQNLALLYPQPGDREAFVDAVRNHRQLRHTERELRRRDGKPVYVIESAIGKFGKQGELTEILGYLIDETERRQNEQELRQAQKMEAVGQLAGGISHDFNNLLGIINGYCEMLLGDPKIEEVTRRRLGEISKAGQRASSLTRQLLAFSRKQVLQPRVLSLNLVIADIDEMLRRLIGEGIQVRTVLDPDLEAVKADPTQMEQVILNFCINARDAMPEGGTIVIETANVEADETLVARHFPMKPGHYVRLAVSDSGTGMDKETLSHVFEPFFTTKEPEKGTGLGLATVYGIVKQSGGHVWGYSEPGHGSTFSVYLPAATEEAEFRNREAKPLEIMTGSGTILLVEDAAPLRDMTRELLEGSGYTVLEAADGKQAIEIAEQYQGDIALLLTDVVMPKIGGPSLAKNLLQERSGMKVLYMSGYTDGAIVGSGSLEPGTAFLQKPFAAEELAKKVRTLLDSP